MLYDHHLQCRLKQLDFRPNEDTSIYGDDPGRYAVVLVTVDITNLFHRKIREVVNSQEQNFDW